MLAWIAAQSFPSMFLSEVTVAEIRQGIERQDDPAKRTSLGHWLAQELRPGFGDRILKVTEDVLYICLGLLREARKRRRTIPLPDALIAAMALSHGLTVASRDLRPYRDAGCSVVSPWEV